MFDHYLLASPRSGGMIRSAVESRAIHSGKSLEAHVFMSKGELETDELSPHQEFHDQLAARNYEGLDLHWQVPK